MTIVGVATARVTSTPDSIFKQPLQSFTRPRQCVPAQIKARVGLWLTLDNLEGRWSAARRNIVVVARSFAACEGGQQKSASPCGAPPTLRVSAGRSLRDTQRADIATANAAANIRCGVLGVGTVLPGEDGGAYRPLIRPAFAAFVLTASSRERQSHVVGPDGDPQPPGRVAANHARGRRASFHFKNASRSAPHE